MRAMTRGAMLALGAALAACGRSEPPADLVQKAETALPPGQSGFWNSEGQAAGSASGDPADYGAHVDDQRLLYWSFDAKPATLGTKPGTPVSPLAGVEIYRDAYGVPIVYADNAHDLWFGVGYAIAQDRLFLMDATRRTGAGTLAELAGCGSVPADAQQRIVGYSDAEYAAFFAAMSPDSREFVQGYVDGANAWRLEAIADPALLPAEYTLLQTTPTEFTVKDVLAAGVYITRYVAAEGGNEFLNIQMLKQLELEYGSRAAALAAFQDMVWLDDPQAVTSVPAGLGVFSNQDGEAAGRDNTFTQMANWALGLPETVWKGQGTGHAAEVGSCSAQAQATSTRAFAKARKGRARPARLEGAATQVRKVLKQLARLFASRDGHSFGFALAGSITRDGGGMLISAPQLGYSYPLLLAEYEIHGAGYDARGVSVPMLPVVGIGYTTDVAWALTTGYSKTIDSFVETTCSTAQQQAGACAADQYFHAGQWKDMDCRVETVAYRDSVQGVPSGPAANSQDYRACRTVHGPVVARDDAKGVARSLQFAIFGRELETIEGVRAWNRAKTLEDFISGVRQVTWNENAIVATRDGQIGYFHPGLFPRRGAGADMRLPARGTGEHDLGAPLPFEKLPHAVNPPQGFVANWNNKPAAGWLDGEGFGSTSRAAGAGQRVTNLIDLLGSRHGWTFADLRAADIHAGTRDPRAREYLPVIAAFRATAFGDLSEVQRAALDRMLAWDRSHYGPGIDLADDTTWVDGPGATLFGAYVDALRDELFGSLKNNVIDPGTPDSDPNNPNPDSGLTIYGRIAGVGSHRFDQSVMDNLVVRVLAPESSGLSVRRDYTGGRTRDAVMRAALEVALSRLEVDSVDGLDGLRRSHPRSQICSLTGAVGPGSDAAPGTSCVEMPYQDRGSWVHRVGWER
ncbi:MAG TPA: penicillin acylase family protein [Verrucomicrobiae bacterium]|nr:penicillin acylase family protein [Verrucomicrobiae bacterium]